jgi:hypothetical protein
MDIATKFTFG